MIRTQTLPNIYNLFKMKRFRESIDAENEGVRKRSEVIDVFSLGANPNQFHF
jgi:hypothetical protein